MDSSEHKTFESSGFHSRRKQSVLVRIKEWVLVDGDRNHIAFGIAVAIFLLFVVLNWVGVIAFVNDDSITRMSGGMIAGTLSLVTLVVSINQLILSREFQSAGEVRKQIGEFREFHEDVEAATGVPSAPPEPTQLLKLLVVDINTHATALSEAISNHSDDEFQTLIEEYVRHVEESSDHIADTLEKTDFGTFNALSAAIEYNDAWQLYAARQLRNRYDSSMSEEALAELDSLLDALQRFRVAREHFKTTYLQRELTQFSQLTIVYGIPSVIAAMLVALVYADFGGATFSLTYMPYVTSALIAVVVLPLAVLAAYILRTAAITHRTAAVTPTLPEKDLDEGAFDVEYGSQE